MNRTAGRHRIQPDLKKELVRFCMPQIWVNYLGIDILKQITYAAVEKEVKAKQRQAAKLERSLRNRSSGKS